MCFGFSVMFIVYTVTTHIIRVLIILHQQSLEVKDGTNDILSMVVI